MEEGGEGGGLPLNTIVAKNHRGVANRRTNQNKISDSIFNKLSVLNHVILSVLNVHIFAASLY